MRSGKKLEFLRLDYELEATAFSEEPLQVEGAVLEELDVFGSNYFLLRHEGNGASGPSLNESFVQIEKIIKAPFAFPQALLVLAFGHVDYVLAIIVWVGY